MMQSFLLRPWTKNAHLGALAGGWFVGVVMASGMTIAQAGEAEVINATAVQDSRGTWTISATLLHADTGWEHYAGRFDVLDQDGNLLGSRTLFHPHVEEQPFTRSLHAVTIDESVSTITVRAHDSVHGLGGQSFEVTLER